MTKSRTAYPTDLNDTEYAQIAPLLETSKKRGRPREISYQEILNAIFYVLKTGCGWRELPHDFPKWKTVYHYFRQFHLYGLWEEINEQVHKAVRIQAGRAAEPTALIIDCQSIKSAEGGEAIGFDGNKKVHGRKRVLLTDTLGFARLVKVVSADQHDSQVGFQLLYQLHQRPRLLPRVRKIFADGGFRGNLEEWVKLALHLKLDIVLKEEGQKGFQVLPKRWVIERTNAWVSRQRRLARDYERTTASCESFLYATMIRLGLQRLSHGQIYQTVSKGHDLRRNGRYALHYAVSHPKGTITEFIITGSAENIVDSVKRSLVSQLASYSPAYHSGLFELSIESAVTTIYKMVYQFGGTGGAAMASNLEDTVPTKEDVKVKLLSMVDLGIEVESIAGRQLRQP